MLAGIEGSSQGYWGSRKCGKRGIEIVGHVDYIQEAENKVEGMQGAQACTLLSVHLCSQVCTFVLRCAPLFSGVRLVGGEQGQSGRQVVAHWKSTQAGNFVASYRFSIIPLFGGKARR